MTGAPEGAREGFETRARAAIAAATAVSARLDALANAPKCARALRILQIGDGPLTGETLRFAEKTHARVTVLELDARRLERLRLTHAHAHEVSYCGEVDSLAKGSFDLVVSAGGLSRLRAPRDLARRIVEKCASKALLLAAEPVPSLFQDLVFGLDDDWSGKQGARVRDPESWASLLSRAGFCEVEAGRLGEAGDEAALVTGVAPPRDARGFSDDEICLIGETWAAADAFTLTLRDALARGDASLRLVKPRELAGLAPARLVWIAGDAPGDAVDRVAARCSALRGLALGVDASRKCRIDVVVDAGDRAVAEAIVSFARTIANEFPSIVVRRIAVDCMSQGVASRLAALILSESPETDVEIGDHSVRFLRYATSPIESSARERSRPAALRLERSLGGGIDRLAWRRTQRKEPGAGEIEVEVCATGLNFRDVMFALSILPESMLEDGLTGPTLGLEFSGRVVGVGPDVEAFQIGDDVVGFAGSAFATHVTAKVEQVAHLPATISRQAAATVPVAFLTAYYGLVACADLRPGEWVLIHGGAGAVGLAALQIAKWRGARAIATAGSEEKRDLARLYGAEFAFDSHSGAFVDDVLQTTGGEGVSVVLNSLAGEAMERSLGLLRPFGRFVELGKRDYLANTPIGLRPFRHNLSYFGVDLDQLLMFRPDKARELFAEVLERFAANDFAPLPYSVFSHAETVAAMRLMQQSGHVGKILVRPPPPAQEARATPAIRGRS